MLRINTPVKVHLDISWAQSGRSEQVRIASWTHVFNLLFSLEEEFQLSPSNHISCFGYHLCEKLSHLLTRRRLYLRCKKRMHCHSFIALTKSSDMSAPDWLSQTREMCMCRNGQFFSVVEILIKNSSLCN